LSCASITQTGHVGSFGPSTHEDATQCEFASLWLKTFINQVMSYIASSLGTPGDGAMAWPSSWHPNVRKLLLDNYGPGPKPHLWVWDDDANTYNPKVYKVLSGGSDGADQIVNGFRTGLEEPNMLRRNCWPHIWRAAMTRAKSMHDSSQESIDQLFTDLAFLHECPFSPLKAKMIEMFRVKWLKKDEDEMVAYLDKEVLGRNFSRSDGFPGKPSDTCTLESFNRNLKSVNYFNSVEGMCTVLKRAPTVCMRISRDAPSFAMVPTVPMEDWKKAQKMVADGWCKLGFKLNNSNILPSEAMIKNHVPNTCDTVAKKRDHIKKWAEEFRGVCKNPGGYAKVVNGEWDFDILVDMIFSFCVLTPIDEKHPQYKRLKEIGIVFKCSCPRFQHYHFCKHSLAWGIHTGEVCVPLKFSTAPATKRKAPAGASLSKRGKCLQID